MEGIMQKCEVCSAKEGAPVRLPAGDTVPRQMYRCPSCKTVICNGCLRQEYVTPKKVSRNPLKIFSEMISGNTDLGIVRSSCSICNAIVDLENDRVAVEVV
jgi:hypothetical protein